MPCERRQLTRVSGFVEGEEDQRQVPLVTEAVEQPSAALSLSE